MARYVLDRDSSEPLYQQLAAALRREIEEGRLPPGVAFPSERKLMARYHVTRATVRSALGVLKQEGRVESEHGSGSFVRDPKAERRRVEARAVGTARPRVGPLEESAGEPSTERAFKIQGLVGDLTRRIPVTPWVAELLQVAPGTVVLVQEGTGIDVTGAPILARVWLHPVAEEKAQIREEELSGFWLPHLLNLKGLPGEEGEDVVEASMPTPHLKALLALPDGVPVLQLYRVMREQEQVVAVIESHLPGDMTTLVFPRVQEGF
jgi:GntR family transcriptional regulator